MSYKGAIISISSQNNTINHHLFTFVILYRCLYIQMFIQNPLNRLLIIIL